MAAVSDIPGDSKFSRALASSDYHVRSQGLAALHVWLQRKQHVPEIGLQKLWRGILFCFWHSDQSHVQTQLADQLVKMMMDLSEKVALSYFQSFVQTMYREWGAIDKLRLDKFMMLVRKFIHGVFSMLQRHGWENDMVGQYADCILNHAFPSDDVGQIGFSLHLADVYIPELLAVEKQALPSSLPHDQCTRLLQPWIAVLAKSKQTTLMQRIKTSVLEAFADELQSPHKKSKYKCFALVERSQIADSIFEAGAAVGLSPKNRAALYDASETFQRSVKKRRRESAQPATPSGEVNALAQHSGSPPNGAAREQPPSTDSSYLPKKKKLRAQAKQGESEHGTESDLGQGHGHKRMKNAAVNGTNANKAASAAMHRQRKSGKKRTSNTATPSGTSPNGGSGTCKGMQGYGVTQEDVVMLTPQAISALSGAVNKVQVAKAKKRISFDLSKNIVWKANQPLPPAALRTPPSAKPNGSALKVRSSVAKTKTARRLSL